MHGVRHLFDREGLSDDVGPIDGGVVHVHLDFLTQELLVHIPDDRVLIHGQAGIQRTVDHRIANGLNVDSVRANLIIRVNLAIDRICFVVEGKDLERVGMHVQRVLL